ncbi:alpha/beta hydrolase [Rhodobacteraceae bacterium R_SAG10]|nr:alpha/beta hydrolase [Rhodobacteraceae bacterium R_SAG10]
MPEFLTTSSGRRIAYEKSTGDAPGIVFLGGFVSDMQGSKAAHLEAWARAQGRAFLRFDYSGHGQSSGDFSDGCIGDWVQDAVAVINGVTDGKQVLVGSSMGGWISLILAAEIPDKISGIIGISTAADFTEDGFWDGFSENQRQDLHKLGQVAIPSEYDEPYIITRRLIEDGRRHLVLRRPLPLPFPVRLLHGSDDTSVKLSVPLHILAHASGDDIRLTLVKGADHSFSTPDCLALIESAVQQVIDRA